ncbi:ATP-binding protein [Paenibacillus sp. MER 99-2]|uniref:hybrid sensor histidine kinase/response regulator n=1 Tax=Paenibacillus sp. MER 99-2 TaxID=2939572 RepID=UPI00204034B1|nr:ATP-binding protein [Paenibacillus sp. MER 99-2]MCM3173803.1 ATP-binding protein [Paenibacillus sp. MER 99-2]
MKKHWIMLTISFICIVIFPLGWVAHTLISDRTNPTVQDGFIDLTQWDFDQKGSATLDGDWDFYPNQLLTPVDLEADRSGRKALSPHSQVKVPSQWNKTLGQAHGFGTYHVRIKIDPNVIKNDYGIRSQNIRMAHRIFLDGKEIGGKGLPGVNPDIDIQLNLPFTGFTSIDGESADILIQVSNYSYSSGGIVASVLFGDERSIQNSQQWSWLTDLMALFGFLFPAAFFLLLFRLRQNESELRYLGLFSLAGATYALTHGEKLLGTFLPFLPNNEILRIQFLSAALAYYYLLRYIDVIVPGAVHQWFVRLGVTLVILQCVIGLALPPAVFSRLTPYMLLISLVVILYSLRAMVFWLKMRPNDGHFALLSMMSLMMVVVLHTVGAFTTWDTSFLALYELLLFIFIQMILTAIRFAESFREVEALSERLLVIDSLKDEFMANTSHELRTPLHGIINIAQSMLEGAAGEVTKKQAKNLSMITSTGRRLSLLINDILDFSKLKNSEIELKREAVDLESIARTVVEVSDFTFGDKPIVLLQQWPQGMPLVEADEDRLRQILYNLLGNAYKYTHQGEIHLYATVEGDQVTVSVADTGVGIAAEKLEDIFQSYEQGNGTSENVMGGTGLGLSITRKLVELGGGTIWVESVPGEGSVFHFTLPVAQTNLLQASYKPSAAQYVAATQSAEKNNGFIDELDENDYIFEADHTILVVDDDPVNRQVLINLLSTQRYHVIAADSGAAALKLREKHPGIDLVVTDWMMPGMSGIELCRRLRERSSLSELPILMLTARGLPEDIKLGFQAGANDFLSKPVDAGELRARVRTLIEMKASVQGAIRTEMAFLQAQIKPHFLYNALNVIIATCAVNPDKATDLLVELSQYLRGSFDFQNRDQLVPLHKELELVESYVHLEKARFEERLVVLYDVEPGIRLYIPPLSIQPLVENAIRHGVMERASGGTVSLKIANTGDHILVQVEDNGVGISPERLAQVQSGRTEGPGGVGLKNINRRLTSLYGTGLEIESHLGKGSIIRFYVPLE